MKNWLLCILAVATALAGTANADESALRAPESLPLGQRTTVRIYFQSISSTR